MFMQPYILLLSMFIFTFPQYILLPLLQRRDFSSEDNQRYGLPFSGHVNSVDMFRKAKSVFQPVSWSNTKVQSKMSTMLERLQ